MSGIFSLFIIATMAMNQASLVELRQGQTDQLNQTNQAQLLCPTARQFDENGRIVRNTTMRECVITRQFDESGRIIHNGIASRGVISQSFLRMLLNITS